MSLRIGSTAPDFTQDSSEGPIHFHEWAGDSWVVLFSHPADFTPVCTTELGRTANLKKEFDQRNCKIIAVSVDPPDRHKGWIQDINETQNAEVNFPLLADSDRTVSRLYDMLESEADDASTVRSVFVIDHNKKIRAMITYPKSTGRNFNEVLRVIDSMQLTDQYSVATPVDWNDGDECVILPSITDEAVIAEKFPRGYRELKPYLRLTPQPNR